MATLEGNEPGGNRGSNADGAMKYFDGSPAKWEAWRDQLRAWMDLKGVTSQAKMRKYLIFYGGEKIRQLAADWPVKEYPLVCVNPPLFDDAVELLDRQFFGVECRAANRHYFYRLRQKTEENFSSFNSRLRIAAKRCKWETKREVDEHIIDQIIAGARSESLRKELLRKDVPLDEVIRIGEAIEAGDQHIKGFWMERPESSQRSSLERVNRVRPEIPDRARLLDALCCWRCGKEGHFGRDPGCPARQAKCHNCGELGHFAQMCRNPRNRYTSTAGFKRPATEWDRSYREDRNRFDDQNRAGYRGRSDNRDRQSYNAKKIRLIDDMDIDQVEEKRTQRVDIKSEVRPDSPVRGTLFYMGDGKSIACRVGGVRLEMVMDSGATHNVIGERDWAILQEEGSILRNQVLGGTQILKAYAAEQPLKIIVSFTSTIEAGNSQVEAEFHVISGGEASLISYRTGRKLGIIKIGLNVCAIQVQQKPFAKMKDIQITIPINPKVPPVVQSYRPIPLALQPQVDKILDDWLEQDIIEPVRGPPTWVSPFIPVRRSDGGIRGCIDMRRANQAVIREPYPLPTIESLLQRLEGAKLFSRLDLRSAFHQIELTPECRYITTFITSRGCFQFKRLMFGISCGPETFHRTLAALLAGRGRLNFLDDVVVFGRTRQEHDENLQEVLAIVKKYGILLNADKQEIGKTEIDFLGHRVSSKGIEPQESKLDAIKRFRTPKTSEEVRSFLGLVTFVAKFVPDLATMTAPLRILLESGKSFEWKEEQEKAFDTIKTKILEGKCLSFFEKGLRTHLICDASPTGLGAVLLQTDDQNQRRIIAFASRSLSKLEGKYAQTEREALAIVWGMKSKPCARLERWVLDVQAYSFTVKHIPGKENFSDVLSRLSEGRDEPEGDSEAAIRQLVEVLIPKSVKRHEIETEAQVDYEFQFIKEALNSGVWHPLPDDFPTIYRILKKELCFSGHILLRGEKIVVPRSLRERMMVIGHEGHPGAHSMKSRIRTKLWWPFMDADIEQFVKSCESCLLVSSKSPPEPLKRTLLPSEPWEALAADFMGPLPSGDYLFTLTDYFSRWLEVKVTRSTTSNFVVRALKEIFSRFGYPLSLLVDNAPNLVGEEVVKFCDERDINLIFSTPYWPQRNGLVERHHRDILRTLQICAAEKKDWKEGLLDFLFMYRTTPHSVTGKPPAELLFGRRIRDRLPLVYSGFLDDEEIRERDRIRKEAGKEYTDRRRRATSSTLKPKDIVVLRDVTPKNKLSTRFGAEKFFVLTRSGGEVIVESLQDGRIVRRNVADAKLVSSTEVTENPTVSRQHEDLVESPVEILEEGNSPASRSELIQEDFENSQMGVPQEVEVPISSQPGPSVPDSERPDPNSSDTNTDGTDVTAQDDLLGAEREDEPIPKEAPSADGKVTRAGRVIRRPDRYEDHVMYIIGE